MIESLSFEPMQRQMSRKRAFLSDFSTFYFKKNVEKLRSLFYFEVIF
jgi:hypothetical protein